MTFFNFLCFFFFLTQVSFTMPACLLAYNNTSRYYPETLCNLSSRKLANLEKSWLAKKKTNLWTFLFEWISGGLSRKSSVNASNLKLFLQRVLRRYGGFGCEHVVAGRHSTRCSMKNDLKPHSFFSFRGISKA